MVSFLQPAPPSGSHSANNRHLVCSLYQNLKTTSAPQHKDVTLFSGITTSSVLHHWFLSGLLSCSPWSQEFVYHVPSYLIISLKVFLSLSSSLENSLKVFDSFPRSIMSHLQNVACSSCSFQNVFFKERLSVWHCNRIGFKRHTELDLKNFFTDSGFMLNKSVGQRFFNLRFVIKFRMTYLDL
jgi:hypothetical protein